MIATTRSLVVLAVIAAVLGVGVWLVPPRTNAAVDRSLVPRFDPATVTQLVFERDGSRSSTVVRAGNAWSVDSAPANPATVDAVLTALRGARWHRIGPASAAGHLGSTLRLTPGPTLSVGQQLTGSEQTWIVRGDRALLVDNWVVRALAPSRLDLRVRYPLAAVKLDPKQAGMWIDPVILQTTRDALDNLELVDTDGDATTDPVQTAFGARSIGVCPASKAVWIETPVGRGCVKPEAWKVVVDAAATLAHPAPELADKRPVPIAPLKVILSDHKELTVAGRPQLGETDADGERVAELLTALATPGELVELPTTAHTDAFLATGADGVQVQLYLYGKGIVGRRGEPIAIKTPLTSVIARESADYRDPTRWREDALTISSIKIDHVVYERGAVIGEWTRKPAGKVDAPLVDALAQTLAIVRAPSNAGNGKTTNGQTITVTFTPPMGAPSTHTLVVSGLLRDGCRGRVDKDEVILSPELCAAAAALHP